MKDVGAEVLTISRNEVITTTVMTLANLYQNAINEDVFWGNDPKQWKCNGIKIKRMTRMLPSGLQVVYLRVTYVFHSRYPSWNISPLDNGPNYRSSALNGTRVAFMTKDKVPYRGLLDGNGLALADNAEPVYLGYPNNGDGYKVYRTVPFGSLNLPGSFAG